MTRRSLWSRSLGAGLAASMSYGVVHDQLSVRLSAPYLMDWHPRIVSSRNPSVVALAWGVVATWWFGLILGAILAFAGTFGKTRLAPWPWMVRAIAFVFATSALAAATAFAIAREFSLEMPNVFGPVYGNLYHAERLLFTQTAAMHEASYDATAIGTLIAAFWIGWRRKSLPAEL